MDRVKQESFELDREHIGILGAIAVGAYTSAKLNGATDAEAMAVVPGALLHFLDTFCSDGILPDGIAPDAFEDSISDLPTEDEEDEDMIPI